MKLTIIIPTLNEESSIGRNLYSLKNIEGSEVVVSDGGSSDRTVERCRNYAKIIISNPGRGVQMNAGAKAASGEILLFLHADSILPENWDGKLLSVMSDESVVGGAFSLEIDSDRLVHKIVAATANLRSRITKIPYGDQGIFVRRSVFEEVGGFKNIPIMEDVDLMRRLKRVGRVALLKDKVRTSARRWDKEGVFYTTIRNWLLIALYYMGVPPERLYRFYKAIR